MKRWLAVAVWPPNDLSVPPRSLGRIRRAHPLLRKCQPGLQHRFTAAIEETIGRILEHSERWRMIEPDIRRCLVKKFPFSVIYSVQGDVVYVIAIAHGSREPGYWKHRLEQ